MSDLRKALIASAKACGFEPIELTDVGEYLLGRDGERVFVDIRIDPRRPETKRVMWNPPSNAEQNWLCIQALRERGFAVCYGDGEGYKHQVWHLKGLGVPIQFDCPSEQFAMLALAEVSKDQ